MQDIVASGRYDYLNEVALTYIFALKISKKSHLEKLNFITI